MKKGIRVFLIKDNVLGLIYLRLKKMKYNRLNIL